MRRYTITLGAPTTAGGKVISASSDGQIDGAPIALEGDLVTCPRCKTAGKILCVGPRIPETWGGKNVALENDLCICRCALAPRLLPNQTLRCQVIKDTGRALSNPGATAVPRSAACLAFSDRFVLVDDHDGAPLPSREYAVVRASGKLEFGTSNHAGQTHLLSATAHAECVEIYAQGSMMTASLISPSGVVLHHRARRRTTLAAETVPKVVRLQVLHNGPRRPRLDADEELLVFQPEDDDCC
ncbi:MAG: PAAR domain-containing protein [Pseudomonadota bacterium]